jgi:hypothetical protein
VPGYSDNCHFGLLNGKEYVETMKIGSRRVSDQVDIHVHPARVVWAYIYAPWCWLLLKLRVIEQHTGDTSPWLQRFQLARDNQGGNHEN